MAMDDDKNQPQNQPQNTGSVVREIERPGKNYATEQEVKVSEELETIGVKAVSDKPEIQPVNEQIGVKFPSEMVPVQNPSHSTVVSIQRLIDDRKKVGPE